MRKELIFLWLCFGTLAAQDLHFSQFTENPSLLNPALCGSESKYRLAATMKDQWGRVSVPYRTYGVSGEMRFPARNWVAADNFRTMTFKKQIAGRLAAGLSAYNDASGDGKLGITVVNLSLASFVPLNKENFLSLGVQGGMLQRRLDGSRLRFPDQFENSQFVPSANSGENFSGYRYTTPDLAAGMLWYYGENRHVVQVEQMLRFRIGFSVQHLLANRNSFLVLTKEQDHKRMVLHGDFTFGIRNSNCALSPAFFMQKQGTLTEFVFGGTLKHFMNEESIYTGIVRRTFFSWGAYYRVGDALIVTTGISWKQQYAFIMSYDVNLSSLNNASRYRGGLELTLKLLGVSESLYENKEAPAKR